MQYLVKAEVILDSVRAKEDDSFGCHNKHKAVQSLQRENTLFVPLLFTRTKAFKLVREEMGPERR